VNNGDVIGSQMVSCH